MSHRLTTALIFAVVLVLLTNAARKDDNTMAAVKCLSEGNNLLVKCPKSNQKLKLKSVAYAHSGEDCNTPIVGNDCIQISRDLTDKSRALCDGKHSCLVPVKSLADLAEEERQARVLVEETISPVKDTCTVGGYLSNNLPMDTFQVLFECQAASNNGIDLLAASWSHPDLGVGKVRRSIFGRGSGNSGDSNADDEEYAFCNKLEDSVVKLTLATPGWPAKSVTNPTCGCEFETSNKDDYSLNGFTHCNGSVTFVTEEWYVDGTSKKLEYTCKDVAAPDYMQMGTKEPYKMSVTVDQEKSDEESAYDISWFNMNLGSKSRRLDAAVLVNCKEGKFWIPYRVQLILQIVLPIVFVLLIALIVVYCIIKKRRAKAKDWRARHVRLPPRANHASTMEMDQTEFISRSPSVDSFSFKKQERVDPEGNVDDIGEYAAQLKKQNEERRKKQLEKRQQGYRPTPQQVPPPSPPHTPPPSRSSIQPSRRAQSYGNLRSDRRYNYADNLDSPMESKPLAYSKSASQSRASVRSLKKKAPQPTGPPQVAPPNFAPPQYPTATGRTSRPSRASSTASIHRNRPRNASQPALYPHHPLTTTLPSRDPPHYATPQPMMAVNPGSPDQDPSNSEDEDMTVMRSRTKPPVTAPKPKLPPKQNPRHLSAANSSRTISPAALGELKREIENSD